MEVSLIPLSFAGGNRHRPFGFSPRGAICRIAGGARQLMTRLFIACSITFSCAREKARTLGAFFIPGLIHRPPVATETEGTRGLKFSILNSSSPNHPSAS